MLPESMSLMELDGGPVEPAEPESVTPLALYNYGHFTSMVVERGGVRGLSLHLRRLVTDCRALFDVDLEEARVRALVRHACARPPVVARVTIFASDLDLSRPGRPLRPRVLVSTRPVPAGPPAAGMPPLQLRTVHYQREVPTVKHVGLFGTVLQRRLAQLAGFDDALFVDRRGRVCEGPTWNMGFVDQHGVVWPRAGCLEGVTMRLLRDGGRVVSRTLDIDLSTARQMRAAFATNAVMGVRPVVSIDDIGFAADHETIAALGHAYTTIEPERL